MSERHEYLSQIFGEGALQINTISIGEKTYGDFNRLDGILPLENVKSQNFGFRSLRVGPEHLAEHYIGPTILPAYRIVELAAMTGEEQNVAQIEHLDFKRIIKPGDCLIAFNDARRRMIVTRKLNGNMQEVMDADIAFDEVGLKPFETGSILEITAQTIAANIMQTSNGHDVRYPIMRSLGRLAVQDPRLTQHLNVIPNSIKLVDPERQILQTSAEIKSDYNKTVAVIDDLCIEMATASQIEIYDTDGRTEQVYA